MKKKSEELDENTNAREIFKLADVSKGLIAIISAQKRISSLKERRALSASEIKKSTRSDYTDARNINQQARAENSLLVLISRGEKNYKNSRV